MADSTPPRPPRPPRAVRLRGRPADPVAGPPSGPPTAPPTAPMPAGPPATLPISAVRGVGLVVGVGLGIAVAVAGLVYAIIAIPLYVLAQSDPDGLDTPMIRNAFFKIALPAGVLVGILAGAAVGAWFAKGGRLPTDRSDIFDR